MDMKFVRSLADHIVQRGTTVAELERFLVTLDTAPAFAIAVGIDKGVTSDEIRAAFLMAINARKGARA